VRHQFVWNLWKAKNLNRSLESNTTKVESNDLLRRRVPC
jgi:hypothetical protein